MKRSPMKRKTRRKRARHDPAYLAWIHDLECVVKHWGCEGPIQASHVTQNMNTRGVGMKAPDRDAVPMCMRHHHEWDGRRGAFGGWTRDERLTSARTWVRETQERLLNVDRAD